MHGHTAMLTHGHTALHHAALARHVLPPPARTWSRSITSPLSSASHERRWGMSTRAWRWTTLIRYVENICSCSSITSCHVSASKQHSLVHSSGWPQHVLYTHGLCTLCTLMVSAHFVHSWPRTFCTLMYTLIWMASAHFGSKQRALPCMPMHRTSKRISIYVLTKSTHQHLYSLKQQSAQSTCSKHDTIQAHRP